MSLKSVCQSDVISFITIVPNSDIWSFQLQNWLAMESMRGHCMIQKQYQKMGIVRCDSISRSGPCQCVSQMSSVL